MKTAEFGKRLYLIGDGEERKKKQIQDFVAEKSDDLAFLEQ